MENSVRKAFVAGKFYPSTASGISELIENIKSREKNAIDFGLSNKQIIGAVLPHAGHVFSGYQAIHFFEILASGTQEIETFVIVHPIHRGSEREFAADDSDAWSTPLGEILVDQEFIDKMNIERSGKLLQGEHSAEVMVPFIQSYFGQKVRIVPIGMGRQNPKASAKIARAVSDAENTTGRKICLIASSDFSHYLDQETGRQKDQLVLDHILKLEPDDIYPVILKNDISVCGYGPIMTLMYYAMNRYPDIRVRILSRGHSGEVYPSDSVVDYISILFFRDS